MHLRLATTCSAPTSSSANAANWRKCLFIPLKWRSWIGTCCLERSRITWHTYRKCSVFWKSTKSTPTSANTPSRVMRRSKRILMPWTGGTEHWNTWLNPGEVSPIFTDKLFSPLVCSKQDNLHLGPQKRFQSPKRGDWNLFLFTYATAAIV